MQTTRRQFIQSCSGSLSAIALGRSFGFAAQTSSAIPIGFQLFTVRGWYEFGGGALADVGHYSLWSVFRLFDLEAPVAVESCPSHPCGLDGNIAVRIKNGNSFPAACTIWFKFAANGGRPALDLFWYDGSIKPPTPEEPKGDELAPEGLMFVGDKGKILADFRGESPRLIPEQRMREYRTAKHLPEMPRTRPDLALGQRRATELWLAACKGGKPTFGDFLLGGPISDAFNLAGVSRRLRRKEPRFD